MQQRQLRLGDILDDYCPRERRVTNHAVVAMVGADVKRTRCTTCDAEHEYKHARVPRQRRKNETALPAPPPGSVAPKRVVHDPPAAPDPVAMRADVQSAEEASVNPENDGEPMAAGPALSDETGSHETGDAAGADEPDERDDDGDGPIHRRLIRASLPRPEGQQPPARPIPDFTIRQPAGRQNRFRGRHQRSGGGGQSGPHGHQFGGNRSNGNMGGPMRGPRPGGGRPGGMNRRGPEGGGRKRSK